MYDDDLFEENQTPQLTPEQEMQAEKERKLEEYFSGASV